MGSKEERKLFDEVITLISRTFSLIIQLLILSVAIILSVATCVLIAWIALLKYSESNVQNDVLIAITVIWTICFIRFIYDVLYFLGTLYLIFENAFALIIGKHFFYSMVVFVMGNIMLAVNFLNPIVAIGETLSPLIVIWFRLSKGGDTEKLMWCMITSIFPPILSVIHQVVYGADLVVRYSFTRTGRKIILTVVGSYIPIITIKPILLLIKLYQRRKRAKRITTR